MLYHLECFSQLDRSSVIISKISVSKQLQTMLVWFGFVFKRWCPHVVDVGFELILLPLHSQLRELQFTAFSLSVLLCF